ncbi:hypothetical protein PF005_g1745 [Phytophthora fragariae]|uniref:Uncharacterized protein n=2 Tax=Phytophthora TaxID=4783 RepID=A0A6A3T4V2_9STRA|nr:hypothetical protein PF003_g34223 [Phytophthora fragariae]KAE9021242.1 hypothetical protein PR002_g12302 [Phytophthora rubi]KAE8947426.1 hypothetical protein PF009_g2967 [Phytophthora fragariae]KAE8991396.1 hypothetical protein PF011_g17964 [Phytophthora fragariae]KAE9127542.1 hypothetical protein PF010_g4835 [Phytophthora fragariae]
MAAGLPDDLVLEYDMLQLVDGDDLISSSFHMDAAPPASPSASAHVEELLANCSVGVSIATTDAGASASASASGSCASSACAAGGAGCSSATASKSPEPAETNTHDEFAAFLLDGEQFLRDMEKVVKIDLENQKTQTALEQSDGAIDLDAFTGLDMLPSPCPSVPSTCPSTADGSPCRNEEDEFDVECPLLAGEQKKHEEEQARRYHEALMGHVLPPMSPPRLPHTDSNLSTTSDVSDVSSLGHTDDSVSASPLPAMLEELDNEEDEEMEEEAMEDEVDLLEKEVKYLDAQRDFLQSRAKSSRPQRKSIKQRRPRDTEQPKLLAKSQEDNQLLNDLVNQQKVYQDNFKAMLAFAPVNDVRMALMTPMESYIRLGKDFNERRKTILSLREEKLDMTYKFIEQKAAGLDINQPYQYSDTFEKFGKHYCVNFAISKYDGVSVFQVGRAIYEQIAGKDEALNNAMGSTTIRESFDTIKCNFMHQRIVSSMHWDGEDADKMPDTESNAIFFCRFGDNSAVLATDYIDQDDLHPYDTSNRIRKDVSSGVVLSGHTDANGKKFVVMKRYLMAKYHMYPHKVSQEQQDRFFAAMPKCHDTMKTLIVDRLQRNETGCPCAGED